MNVCLMSPEPAIVHAPSASLTLEDARGGNLAIYFHDLDDIERWLLEARDRVQLAKAAQANPQRADEVEILPFGEVPDIAPISKPIDLQAPDAVTVPCADTHGWCD